MAGQTPRFVACPFVVQNTTSLLFEIDVWILKDNDLACTGLAAPDRSVDAVSVEVAVLLDVTNKDSAVIDDPTSLSLGKPRCAAKGLRKKVLKGRNFLGFRWFNHV